MTNDSLKIINYIYILTDNKSLKNLCINKKIGKLFFLYTVHYRLSTQIEPNQKVRN